MAHTPFMYRHIPILPEVLHSLGIPTIKVKIMLTESGAYRQVLFSKDRGWGGWRDMDVRRSKK